MATRTATRDERTNALLGAIIEAHAEPESPARLASIPP
jgi:hypothetical protein